MVNEEGEIINIAGLSFTTFSAIYCFFFQMLRL